MNTSPSDRWYERAFDGDYLEVYSHRNTEEARHDVDWIINQFKLTTDQRILDAGCGAGRHVHAFSERGFRAVGLDLSRALLSEGRRHNSESWFVRGDLRFLPFQKKFDLVTFLFTTCGYFPTLEDDQRVLNSARNALQSGGYILIDFLDSQHTREHLKSFTTRNLSGGRRLDEHRHIDPSTNRVVKRRVLYDGDRVQESWESVYLHDESSLSNLLYHAGFVDISSYPSMRTNDPEQRRLIMIAHSP